MFRLINTVQTVSEKSIFLTTVYMYLLLGCASTIGVVSWFGLFVLEPIGVNEIIPTIALTIISWILVYKIFKQDEVWLPEGSGWSSLLVVPFIGIPFGYVIYGAGIFGGVIILHGIFGIFPDNPALLPNPYNRDIHLFWYVVGLEGVVMSFYFTLGIIFGIFFEIVSLLSRLFTGRPLQPTVMDYPNNSKVSIIRTISTLSFPSYLFVICGGLGFLFLHAWGFSWNSGGWVIAGFWLVGLIGFVILLVLIYGYSKETEEILE